MTLTHTDVVAEDAPLGVQLWPTTSPESAPNFTLAEVLVTTRKSRDQFGSTEHSAVTWFYENGETRNFALGEKVACQLPVQS